MLGVTLKQRHGIFKCGGLNSVYSHQYEREQAMSGQKKIIMNFSAPPSIEDLTSIAESCLDLLPEELDDMIEGLDIVVDDFPPQDVLDEFGLETEFELLALYRDHEEKIPGVASKSGDDSKTLYLYRRPILDVWCETEDDLNGLMRHLMITELAQNCGFDAGEIEALANRPHQGLL